MLCRRSEYQPPPVLKIPVREPVDRLVSLEAKDIIFKLLTTGHKYYKDDILVIAAFSVNSQRGFLKYMLRKKPVEEVFIDKAKRRLGPETRLYGGRYCMYNDGKRVETVTFADAIKSFVAFLKEEASDGLLNLTGDNSIHHDVFFLNEALIETGLLQDFESVVGFYTDTSYLFKEAWPTITQDKRAPRCLIEDILEEVFKDYNPAEDIKALGKLVEIARGSFLYVKAGTYSYANIKAYIDYTKRKHDLEDTLEPLFKTVRPVIISQVLAKKMTSTGISFEHLQEAYRHSQREGLRVILTMPINENPRVTQSEVTLDKLCKFFSKLSPTSPCGG